MTPFDTCTLCPRLCRSACPVATGTGREIATPTWIATVLRAHARGNATADDARAVATLCADCGGCADHCHVHVPLPDLLHEARVGLGLRSDVVPEPLEGVEGEGSAVCVEVDEVPLAELLAARSGRRVRRWRTRDALGVAAIGSAGWVDHVRALREAVGGLEVVIAHGGVARALDAAGIPYHWAWTWLGEPLPGVGSCAAGGPRPLACCGANGPLAAHHPDDARDVARMFAARARGDDPKGPSGPGPVFADVRCVHHLRAAGCAAQRWLEDGPAEEQT